MRLIQVVPYNSLWPEMFKEEAEKVKKALGENCVEIHHIGSTSVPGLAAKPVIDIIPVVRDITKVDEANERMMVLGYEAQGEFGIPFRRYFQKGGDDRTHNVHIFEQGSPEVDRHLKFRDWMRTHDDDRNAYAGLKHQLAKQFPHDTVGYCNGKDVFISDIDFKAGLSNQPRLMLVCTDREWEVYHTMRAQLLFAPQGVVYDRNHSSIINVSQYHFVLYVGTKIVSVAQVEKLAGTVFSLRSLATSPEERNKGYGSACMGLLEKWMKQQGCKIIKLHAALPAEEFYRSLGYVDMPFDSDMTILRKYIDLGKEL
jgi:GrpB-like predicted nucleotidyltransferase (UPF0157 family)/GNAT superfamily N-acetyltransferase